MLLIGSNSFVLSASFNFCDWLQPIIVNMRHPAYFTICVRIPSRTTLFTMQIQLHVNLLWITKTLFNAFDLKLKHLYSYTMIQITFSFTCVRILIGSTLRILRVKFIYLLLVISEINKTVRCVYCMKCNASALRRS